MRRTRWNLLINKEVKEWNNEDSVPFVKKEIDVHTRKSIARIHRILNHKRIENMEYVYRNAEKLNPETRALIK